MTLFDNEVAAIVGMRKKGHAFSYIAEEIGGVCREVIGRELAVQEVRPTASRQTDGHAGAVASGGASTKSLAKCASLTTIRLAFNGAVIV